MKIAQVAPLYESVPPQAYGGTERVVSYLTEALVDLGHDVTLYASADSVTSADLVGVVEQGLRLDPRRPDPLVWHTLLLERVMQDAHEFDVIHFHTEVLQYPFAVRCPTPSLTTLHGRLDRPGLAELHERFRAHPLVAISEHQRGCMPGAPWIATVPHGIPQGLYDFHPEPGDYFAFLGRLSPEKRPDRAIEIARACGVPLKIAAKVDDADRAYVTHHLRPHLEDPVVEFVGEIGEDRKSDFLGRARALLFPIDWPEPFGLVMIESLACGTPVVAYRCGSVPEVIEEGVTGYVVENQAAAIEAAARVHRLDRGACREAFERRFGADRMAMDYVRIYEALQAERSGARGSSAQELADRTAAAGEVGEDPGSAPAGALPADAGPMT